MKKQNLIQMVLGVALAAVISMAGTLAWADDTTQLKEQVQALQNKVDQLQSELAHDQQVREDPFAQMALMQQQMQGNMRQPFADTGAAFNPRMDMKKTDKDYVITMDIPGMDKDKINVEVKEGTLVISSERQSEETQDNKSNQYYRQERSFGTFMQVIPLPEDAKASQIDAQYKNGVLTVTVAREKKDQNVSGEQKITVK